MSSKGRGRTNIPTRPLAKTMAATIMEKAAKELGYHPFQAPAANMSEVYTNTEGLTLGACEYCGHCERFGCEGQREGVRRSPCILPGAAARSEVRIAHPRLRQGAGLRTGRAKKCEGGALCRYPVAARSSQQPAGIVLLGAYVFNNMLLMRMAVYRRAVRSGHRQGRNRQELLLPGQRGNGVLVCSSKTRKSTRSWPRVPRTV